MLVKTQTELNSWPMPQALCLAVLACVTSAAVAAFPCHTSMSDVGTSFDLTALVRQPINAYNVTVRFCLGVCVCFIMMFSGCII